MGALASLLLAKGHRVSGSDLRQNHMTRQLKNSGAHIFLGHDAKHINHIDCIVYSSAIDDDNTELLAGRTMNIPLIQRAKLLAELMGEYVGITVAGTHGKTTTTSMICDVLEKGGLCPTTAIGGIINGMTVNANLGSGNYFVTEVDESDGSFLYFRPKYSVITNMDCEHMDYYHNWENVCKTYKKFILKTASDGMLFINGDDKVLVDLVRQSSRNYQTYGFSPQHDLTAQDLEFGYFYSTFSCVLRGKPLGRVHLMFPGQHNVANALATISVGLKLGLDFETIVNGLRTFRGVQRRFQRMGETNGILVVNDYAHHPTEIKATLETANLIKKNRIITIFQPHRYTRLKLLLKDFAESLKLSDHLIVTDIYAASERSIQGVTPDALLREMEKISKKPHIYQKREDIVNYVLNIAKAGDLVMTLGAGDITVVAEDIVQALKSQHVHNFGAEIEWIGRKI